MNFPSLNLFTGSLLIAIVIVKLFEKALHLYTKEIVHVSPTYTKR